MTVGRLTGALVLIPGGALTDALPWKRALAATGLLMIACAALILAVKPSGSKSCLHRRWGYLSCTSLERDARTDETAK
jgi:hypothetical protein